MGRTKYTTTAKNKLFFMRNQLNLNIRDIEKMTTSLNSKSNNNCLSNTTISLLENGKRPFRQTHIDCLCDLFQVTPNFLLGIDDVGIIVNGNTNNKLYISEQEYLKLKSNGKILEVYIEYPRNKDMELLSINDRLEYIANGYYKRTILGSATDEDLKAILKRKYENIGERLSVEELEKVIKFIEDFILYN